MASYEPALSSSTSASLDSSSTLSLSSSSSMSSVSPWADECDFPHVEQWRIYTWDFVHEQVIFFPPVLLTRGVNLVIFIWQPSLHLPISNEFYALPVGAVADGRLVISLSWPRRTARVSLSYKWKRMVLISGQLCCKTVARWSVADMLGAQAIHE